MCSSVMFNLTHPIIKFISPIIGHHASCRTPKTKSRTTTLWRGASIRKYPRSRANRWRSAKTPLSCPGLTIKSGNTSYLCHDSELATQKSGSKRKAVDPRGVEQFTDSNIYEVADKRQRLTGLVLHASEFARLHSRSLSFTESLVSLDKVKRHVKILASPATVPWTRVRIIILPPRIAFRTLPFARRTTF